METALILLVLALSALIGLKIGMWYKLSSLRLKIAQLKYRNEAMKAKFLQEQNVRLIKMNSLILKYRN